MPILDRMMVFGTEMCCPSLLNRMSISGEERPKEVIFNRISESGVLINSCRFYHVMLGQIIIKIYTIHTTEGTMLLLN